MDKKYGFVDPSKIQFEEKAQPSTLGKVARSGAQLVTEAVKSPFQLAELPARAVGYITGRKPKDKFLSDQIQVVKEKYLGKYEPESIPEKALFYTAGSWPTLFLGGAPTFAKVGADIAGSAALATAEKVTNNPLVKIGADILGRKGFKSVVKYLTLVPKESGKIKSYISDLYAKENELGSSIPAKDTSRKISRELDKIHEDLRKEYVNPGKFDEAARNRVLKNLETAEQSLNKPNISLADLAQEEKNLNKAWSFKNSTENGYYKNIKKIFSDELKASASKHKEWGHAYDTAKQLYKIDKWNVGLDKWIQHTVGNDTLGKILSNPEAQSAVSFLGGLATKGPKGAIIGAALPYANKKVVKGIESAERARRFIAKLSDHPEGRKLLMEIVTDSANNNFSALNKSMNKLNKYADKLESGSDQYNIDRGYVDPKKITFL